MNRAISIRYRLNLNNRAHAGMNELKKISWLHTKERFLQCISVDISKVFNNMPPGYWSEKAASGRKLYLILDQDYGIRYHRKSDYAESKHL